MGIIFVIFYIVSVHSVWVLYMFVLLTFVSSGVCVRDLVFAFSEVVYLRTAEFWCDRSRWLRFSSGVFD